MLIESISKYLLTNKRLVVPNLGAFIVKVPGEKILFSNLMKGDDGVLRQLLTENGISELEAAGLIDRFVFEVNYRLQNGGVCDIKGFGRMVAGANGSISFEYNPSVQGDNLEGDISMRKVAQNNADKQEEQVDAPSESVAEPSPAEKESAEKAVEEQPSAPSVAPMADSANAATRPADPQLRRVPVRRIYGETGNENRRVHPDNYTKGLRYGKGNKVVTGRESATSRRSNKGDVIIKIAIAAAVIAILALAYGLYNDWRFGTLGEQSAPMIDNRDIYDVVPESAEAGVRNPDLDYITPKE